jgi:hypothetical protein
VKYSILEIAVSVLMINVRDYSYDVCFITNNRFTIVREILKNFTLKCHKNQQLRTGLAPGYSELGRRALPDRLAFVSFDAAHMELGWPLWNRCPGRR